MARPRVLTGLLIAAGTAAAAVVLRRRASRPQTRVELYFEDGTLSTVDAGAPGSERLLALAREALSAARPVL
jgi:hypothetical protein